MGICAFAKQSFSKCFLQFQYNGRCCLLATGSPAIPTQVTGGCGQGRWKALSGISVPRIYSLLWGSRGVIKCQNWFANGCLFVHNWVEIALNVHTCKGGLPVRLFDSSFSYHKPADRPMGHSGLMRNQAGSTGANQYLWRQAFVWVFWHWVWRQKRGFTGRYVSSHPLPSCCPPSPFPLWWGRRCGGRFLLRRTMQECLSLRLWHG